MRKKCIKIIPWILVIIWMGVIFNFSSMDTNESNEKSEGTISQAITETVKTTNAMGITDKHPTKNKIIELTKKLNKPLRKCMHASVYFILAILLMKRI